MKKLWVIPLLALAIHGADLTGTWTGNVDVADPSNGEKISTPVKAQFEQKGSTISGKIGRTEDVQPEAIRNGKLEGKTLVFEVQPPEATSPMTFRLTLVSDDRIEGDMKG